MSDLVIFANGIGDAVLALPALRCLKDNSSALTIAAPEGHLAKRVFDELGANQVDLAARFSFGMGWSVEEADLHRLCESASRLFLFITWADDIVARTVFALRGRVQSFGDFSFCSVSNASGHEHEADKYFELVRSCGVSAKIDKFVYAPRVPTSEFFPSIMNAVTRDERGFVSVHLETAQDKTMTDDAAVQLLHRLLHRIAVPIVLLGRTQPSRIAGAINSDRLLDGSGLTFGDSVKLLAKSSLCLAVDSCMLHVADLSRVPTVALFKSSSPSEWGVRFAPARTIKATPAKDWDLEEVVHTVDALARATRCDELMARVN